jgi:hypothetical protein
MNKLITLSLILISATFLHAQEGFHQHDGFYLSMSTGPVFGSINDNIGSETVTFSGVGGIFDLKIGGAIKENIILHGAIISSSLSGPRITASNGFSDKAPNSLSLGEAMYAAGATYYYLPFNCFASGTFGIGNFSILDTKNELSYSTPYGFAMQLKVGKEWWVGKNWGLGIAATYGKTMVTDEPSEGVLEQISSNRFGILFNATFN